MKERNKNWLVDALLLNALWLGIFVMAVAFVEMTWDAIIVPKCGFSEMSFKETVIVVMAVRLCTYRRED